MHTMKLFVMAAGVAALASVHAHAAPPTDATWVLLGLDVHMGAVTARDTAADADTVSVYGEGLPVYQTAAACQAALRHALRKYADKSHAEGNYGNFLCTDLRTWAQGR
jgi:hypothetical protein